MSVNFAKYQDDITNAWRKVVDEKDKQNWALYGYEGTSNVIKLMSTGSDGLAGLVLDFNCSLIQYAFCRVIDPDVKLNKLILINWQGDSSPLSRKGLCASHVGDVANYFKGATQTITIRNDDEATQEYLMEQILKSCPNRVVDVCIARQQPRQQMNNSQDNDRENDSFQSKTKLIDDITSKIAEDRKTFWQRQEEEEKQRIEEEKKKTAEKQAHFEKERKSKEQSEFKKLAETIKERDRLIEATRNAERRESSSSSVSTSNSQLGSIINSSNHNHDDGDDDRVGRRSDQIRLERNQETQSLISKGQIKKRRALFEKASQQQDGTNHSSIGQSNFSRRSSGSIIKERLDAFQSMEQNNFQSSQSSLDKLANKTNNINLDGDQPAVVQSVKIETQSIDVLNITKDVDDCKMAENSTNGIQQAPTTTIKPTTNGHSNIDHLINGKQENSYGKEKSSDNEMLNKEEKLINKLDKVVESVEVLQNGNNNVVNTEMKHSPQKVAAIQLERETQQPLQEECHEQVNSVDQDHDVTEEGEQDLSSSKDDSHENNNHITISKSEDELQAFKKIADTLINGREGSDKAKAVAIYDYQAADNTEISFDPNDLIGFIEKVDVGWWHGVVLSGRYTGQSGLFPHNHVMEL